MDSRQHRWCVVMLFFFIELLRKWNYNVGGELDNLEVIKEKHYGIIW